MIFDELFDRIICLHYIPYEERLEPLKQELKRVGILDSPKFEWKLTFDSPLLHNLYKNFPNKCVTQGLFNCAVGHYEVWKTCEMMRYKKVLILEDDVRFLKNVKRVHEIFADTPAEYDYILYDRYAHSNKVIDETVADRYNDNFANHKQVSQFESNGCYAMSYDALYFNVVCQEQKMTYADVPIKYINSLKKYVTIEPPCIQKLYDSSWTATSLKERADREIIYRRTRIDKTKYNLEL